MLTVIFMIALIWVVWKMLILGIKAAWGIAKILCTVLLLPAFLFGLMCVGLMYIAMPILLIVGIIIFVGGLVEA
ncbi:MAG: hypothetical protein NC489_22650 [Ruminococcus flavefaciens]|nr:hypothetical protein [Ruminococcus flavefaciens]